MPVSPPDHDFQEATMTMLYISHKGEGHAVCVFSGLVLLKIRTGED